MNLIIQLIVGGVIGWLASMVMKTNAQMGVIANILVGIVGAGLGGWLAGQLGMGGTGHGLGHGRRGRGHPHRTAQGDRRLQIGGRSTGSRQGSRSPHAEIESRPCEVTT